MVAPKCCYFLGIDSYRKDSLFKESSKDHFHQSCKVIDMLNLEVQHNLLVVKERVYPMDRKDLDYKHGSLLNSLDERSKVLTQLIYHLLLAI